jgi:hypothetical protein
MLLRQLYFLFPVHVIKQRKFTPENYVYKNISSSNLYITLRPSWLVAAYITDILEQYLMHREIYLQC